MDDLTLSASRRELLGKKTRFLRRKGVSPVHLFGRNIESLALQCDTTQLQRIAAQAGMTRAIKLKIDGEKQSKSVFIREIQRDVVTNKLLHVDFYQIRRGEKIRVDVPLVLVGEAPALKGKGRMLIHGVTSLHLECLPESLPSQIEVDISVLEEVEQAIHVGDIVLDPEIAVHADPEQMVVKISEAAVARVEEEMVAEEEVAEVEAEVEAKVEAPEEEAPEETTT